MTKVIETRPTGPAVPLPPPQGLGGRPPTRTPAGVRALWKVFAGLLVVGTLVWGPYQVVTLLAHEERVDEQSWPAAGINRLEIDSANGRVEIVASDRDTVDVRAEISDGLRPTGESRRLVGDTVRLRATCPNFGSNFCWVNYEVSVPRDVEVVVDTHNGSVTVSGSEAALTLNSDNGSVRVDDVSGPLELSSDNGHVEGTGLRSTVVSADSDNGHVTLEFDDAPMTVHASTSNGSVEVVVPNDRTAYRADLATDNGRERLDVPTDPNSARTLVLRSSNGSVTARVR